MFLVIELFSRITCFAVQRYKKNGIKLWYLPEKVQKKKKNTCFEQKKTIFLWYVVKKR